jgi:citrate lyase synthetase
MRTVKPCGPPIRLLSDVSLGIEPLFRTTYIRRATMHQDIHDTTEQELRAALEKIETLKKAYEIVKEAAVRIAKERNQLSELAAYYERELIRERGYI